MLHRVTQNLCNSKRDVDTQENADILERSTAWPPPSKCSAGFQHGHGRTTTAMAGHDAQASPCTSCSWGCSGVSAHSTEGKNPTNPPHDVSSIFGPLGPITAGAMHVFRRQDSENRCNTPQKKSQGSLYPMVSVQLPHGTSCHAPSSGDGHWAADTLWSPRHCGVMGLFWCWLSHHRGFSRATCCCSNQGWKCCFVG